MSAPTNAFSVSRSNAPNMVVSSPEAPHAATKGFIATRKAAAMFAHGLPGTIRRTSVAVRKTMATPAVTLHILPAVTMSTPSRWSPASRTTRRKFV
jgi:hypothetical protein